MLLLPQKLDLKMRITLSVINDLVTDQRVHRIATSLTKNGYNVLLIGRILPRSKPVEREYRTSRMKLLFIKGPAFYAEYNIRLFFKLLFTKTDILLANDLDTLLANYLVSIIRRKPLVYDAHELFTEMPELVERPTVRKIWSRIEQFILPKVKHSYTVCESIAKIYNEKYHINMKVVRNLPLRNYNGIDLKPSIQLPPDGFVLYQGAVNIGRGIEAVIDAFQYIDNTHFLIVGDGDIFQQLKDKVKAMQLENKVIFTGQLPFQQLHTITPHAGLGVTIVEHLGLNYYYGLPNKLFDCIQAGVPSLVPDFPEMSNIVNTYGVGEILISREPKVLAKQITQILQKPKSFWKENMERAAIDLCWEEEEKQLMSVVNAAKE
jgi:glycosyltransferase involved in cell wall biosynthesis